MFQFYVANGKLSCQLYQRSGDVFLGVPYNIASYALLTRMIAQQTGLEAGEFIHTLGDAHIYLNHVEQVKEQVTREPKPLAKLIIKRVPNSIFEYKREDFDIVDYDSHGVLKGKVSF
jgi:thymidylate synthase